MTVYFFVYIFSAFFSYFYSVEKNKNVSVLLKLFLFLTLFLPLSLRYDIGTDYINYYQQINWDIDPVSGKWGGFELGWHPLLWLIKTFNLDIHLFFVVTAFFSVFFIIKIIEKESAFYSIIIYVSTLYLDSFSLVRQAFAAILAIYGIKKYFNRQEKKYLIYVFLSVLFHSSLMLFVFLLPLILYYNKKKPFRHITWFNIYIFSFLFFTLVNIPSMMFRILAQSVLRNSSRYFTDSLYGAATKMGSGLGVLLKEMTVIPFLFFMTSEDKFSGKRNSLCMPSLLIVLFIFVSYIFSTQITIMNRIPYIFTTYYLIATQSLYESKNKYRRIGLYILAIIFTANFVVNLIKNPSSASGGLGITPYQSIFSR